MFRLIGVPIDSAGTPGGTELAPGVLRAHGLGDVVGGEDAGDLATQIRADARDPRTGVVGLDDVCATTAAIREAVGRSLSESRIPFLIGGCCTLVPGALAGVRDVRSRAGLIHLDGHLDLYDQVSSPSGEAADMPVAVALGLGPEPWVDAAGGRAADPRDVWIVGYRDREQSAADGMIMPEGFEPPIRATSTDELRRAGPGELGAEAAASMSATGGFWAHLDLDIVDPGLFFANDAPVPDGIDWDELTDLLRPLFASQQLAGFSLGCYNPEKDPNGDNGLRVVQVVAEALRG
jgi:arginase